MLSALIKLVLVVGAAAAALAWVRLGVSRARRSRREVATAQAAFTRSEALAAEFCAAGQATGKPRGLRWKRCELHTASPVIARDTATGELVALAGVTLSFEAIEGGDMEHVEAVGNLRDATAVFVWRRGRWTTDGRAVFNLSPEQALDRYGDALQRV